MDLLFYCGSHVDVSPPRWPEQREGERRGDRGSVEDPECRFEYETNLLFLGERSQESSTDII